MMEAKRRIVEPGITVLELRGRVTLGEETRRLEQAVKAFQPPDVRRLVVGLSEVDYIDSAGLGVLTACLAAVRAAGGRMHLAGPSPRIRQLLRLMGIDRMMPAFEDLDEACRALAEPAAGNPKEN